MNGVAIGKNADIDSDVSLGYGAPPGTERTRIGADARIRSGTIIYDQVRIGDGLQTGHRAVIREDTTLGDDVLVGTDVVIDGATDVGSHVSLQTGSYVPRETTIGNRVFVGPHAVLTNDPYPVRRDVDLDGPDLADNVTIGANATVLPDVRVGENAFVAAGAIVPADVPPDTLAVGAPASHRPLPREIQRGNQLA